MTNDVPTRLLQAVEDMERRARYRLESDDQYAGFEIEPEDVLRLCQAQREIVELCTAVTADNSAPAVVLARLTLRLLADGYGLKEGA